MSKNYFPQGPLSVTTGIETILWECSSASDLYILFSYYWTLSRSSHNLLVF